MPNLLDVSILVNTHLNRETVVESVKKQKWDIVTEVDLKSDFLQLTFEQKNELRGLILDALKKVTRPKNALENEKLIAKQVRAYLLDLHKQADTSLPFTEWLIKVIPTVQGFAEAIENGDIFSYSAHFLQILADHEGLTIEEFLARIEQVWYINNPVDR